MSKKLRSKGAGFLNNGQSNLCLRSNFRIFQKKNNFISILIEIILFLSPNLLRDITAFLN
jgi:hypothetical protein